MKLRMKGRSSSETKRGNVFARMGKRLNTALTSKTTRNHLAIAFVAGVLTAPIVGCDSGGGNADAGMNPDVIVGSDCRRHEDCEPIQACIDSECVESRCRRGGGGSISNDRDEQCDPRCEGNIAVQCECENGIISEVNEDCGTGTCGTNFRGASCQETLPTPCDTYPENGEHRTTLSLTEGNVTEYSHIDFGGDCGTCLMAMIIDSSETGIVEIGLTRGGLPPEIQRIRFQLGQSKSVAPEACSGTTAVFQLCSSEGEACRIESFGTCSMTLAVQGFGEQDVRFVSD